MVGSDVIEIGAEELLKGMTSSSETNDGGFSSESSGVNFNSDQDHLGVLYASASIVDKSTNLNGNIIATVSDPDSGVGVNRYLLTATGRFLSADSSSVLTVRRTSAGAKTYSFPNSDIAIYKNALYATSDNDVTRATGANLVTTFDESWWDTTLALNPLTTGVRHPLLVFEDSLWVGNGNQLHKYDGTTATEGFLTLNTGLVIIALGIDPSTGKMLISASEGANGSDTLPRQCKIYVYDGFSNKPSRAIPVDDMVTEMYAFGGLSIMFYGQNMGYWNGSGIKFMRSMRRVLLSGVYLIYKHRVTNIGKTLYVADGINILAYEEILPGRGVFYFPKVVAESFNNYLDAIFNMGNNILGIGYDSTGSTPKFAVFDKTARTTGELSLYSKKYKFKRPMFVREVRVEFLDQVATTDTPGFITLKNENLTSVATTNLTNGSASSVFSLKAKANASTKFHTLQFIYSNSGSTSIITGIRRFLITVDPAE